MAGKKWAGRLASTLIIAVLWVSVGSSVSAAPAAGGAETYAPAAGGAAVSEVSQVLSAAESAAAAAGSSADVKAADSTAAAQAAPAPAPFGYIADSRGIRWANGDGTFLANDFLHLAGKSFYLDKDGYVAYGYITVGDCVFYMPSDGVIVPGWITTELGESYVLPSGNLAVNAVVDGKTLDARGVAVIPVPAEEAAAVLPAASPDAAMAVPVPEAPKSEFELVCAAILAQITTPEMSNDQKLRRAYDHILAITTYRRTYETPSGEWTKPYALDIYATGQGNCYRYAAAFAYLARELGYTVRVATGQIAASRGGVTPHAWVEINVNGSWLICDPDMEDAKRSNYYMRTYSNYPVKPLNKEREWPIEF